MFTISGAPIDVGKLKQSLRNLHAGALVCFEGWVRDHNEGREVMALEYEAYEGLAVGEGERILEEAGEKFKLCAVACAHRVGRMDIGDLVVWVGATAAHRTAAFQACQFVIDELKVRLPIWKKEYYADGNSGWVNCAPGDAAAHQSFSESIH